MSIDVAFVVMPFADIQSPAIGVSLLQAQLDAHGRTSSVLYFNIRFAELIGESLHRRLSDGLSADALVGEWFFADCVFDDTIPSDTSTYRGFCRARRPQTWWPTFSRRDEDVAPSSTSAQARSSDCSPVLPDSRRPSIKPAPA